MTDWRTLERPTPDVALRNLLILAGWDIVGVDIPDDFMCRVIRVYIWWANSEVVANQHEVHLEVAFAIIEGRDALEIIRGYSRV